MNLVKDLFASKKFIAMLVGIIVTLGAKICFDVDQETAAMIAGIVGAYILGQGISDNGKEAAKIDAEAAKGGE